MLDCRAVLPIGQLLDGYLARRGWKKADLARALGISRGFPSKVTNGHCPMPLDQVDAWADALRLSDAERAALFLAAAMTHLLPDKRSAMARALALRVADQSTHYDAQQDSKQLAAENKDLKERLNRVRDALGPLNQE